MMRAPSSVCSLTDGRMESGSAFAAWTARSIKTCTRGEILSSTYWPKKCKCDSIRPRRICEHIGRTLEAYPKEAPTNTSQPLWGDRLSRPVQLRWRERVEGRRVDRENWIGQFSNRGRNGRAMSTMTTLPTAIILHPNTHCCQPIFLHCERHCRILNWTELNSLINL